MGKRHDTLAFISAWNEQDALITAELIRRRRK
jgi:hypothetical protein